MRLGIGVALAIAWAIAFNAGLYAPSVLAADVIKWKTLQNWHVRVDTTLNYGCFLYASYIGGTVFRIGFNPKRDNAYIMIGNDKWKSLETGKDYKIKIKFDQLKPWVGDAKSIKLGSSKFLSLSFSKFDFLKEFKSKHVMTVTYKGRRLAKLSLKGSSLATNELVKCETSMAILRKKGRSPSDDPFKGKEKKKPLPASDPFY